MTLSTLMIAATAIVAGARPSPMVIGLLIFYACCLQCAATIAVIRRETGGWRWPVFAWGYMTSLGYLGALLAYQLGG